MIDAGFGDCFSGCFFRRILWTVSGGVVKPLNAI